MFFNMPISKRYYTVNSTVNTFTGITGISVYNSTIKSSILLASCDIKNFSGILTLLNQRFNRLYDFLGIFDKKRRDFVTSRSFMISLCPRFSA